MDIDRYSIYEYLRDFSVPASVLDNIFSSEKDLDVLIDAWNSLIKDGYSKDESAKRISELIFKELDIEPDQSSDVEK
ncbi:MAG: hypothetical protein CMG74_10965 [Candidatus Marinimicrobia bacterium]|nr:hypothetical protein [Candidatus Neomarinimicrobiota bacterium]|tara:strand:- start:1731 stop:1961 length:231 start_codon:yes stop_codon:yes gene_type:complete